MHILSSPFHYMRLRRLRERQKRMALHMLALSGVVRPGHVELRYSTSIARISAFRSQASGMNNQQGQPLSLQSPANTQTWQWARSLWSTLVNLAKKPIALGWLHN